MKRGKIILVSNCGFWEKDNFDALVAHVQAICRNISRDFAGALLRPHGPAVGALTEMGAAPQNVLDAARDAGRQLATNGRIEPETLDTVACELMPRDAYLEIVNHRFREALVAGG